MCIKINKLRYQNGKNDKSAKHIPTYYVYSLITHRHTLSRPKYQLITYYIHSTHIMPTLIEGPHTVTLPVNKAKSRVVLRPLLHSGRFCIILSKYYEALLPNKSIK